MIIEQPAKWLRWLYPKALWRMDETDHAVYLTFDDGPIPESTPYLLKILREFDVKATFFVVGDNVRKYPELYRQILADGHRVGNHTFNHIGSTRHSIREYEANVRACNEIMQNEELRMKNEESAPNSGSSSSSSSESGNSDSSLFTLHSSFKTVCDAQWPAFDEEKMKDSEITMPVQFCGKTRFTIQLPAGISKDDAEKAALADERTARYTDGKQVMKVIVVPGRIINIVVK